MGLSKKTTLNNQDVLAAIKTNDGAGSGIDSDMLDGSHKDEIIAEATEAVTDLTSYTAEENKIPMGGTDGTLDASWFTNLADGADGADGTDGITPHIDSTSKNWFIGDIDTGILAEGTNGQDGADGITPHIDSSSKNWFIGDADTGISAEGSNANLPVATSSTLGGVKVGTGLSVASDGELSINFTDKSVTPTAAGFTVSADSGTVLRDVYVAGATDLVAANIASGVNIFGVTGTLEGSSNITLNDEYFQVTVSVLDTSTPGDFLFTLEEDEGAIIFVEKASTETPWGYMLIDFDRNVINNDISSSYIQLYFDGNDVYAYGGTAWKYYFYCTKISRTS